MKVSPQKADAFCRRPDRGIRAVLLYGPDGGMVRERAEILVRGICDPPTDPFRVADLTGREVQQDPARLADEALSLSLVGGRRAVRVRDATDSAAEPVKTVLDGPETESLIVLEAGELTPRSALRKLCESHAAAAAIACYMPDAEDIARLARDMLSAENKSIEADAAGFLAEHLTADRQLARREIEKLIAYLGPDDRADLAAVRASIGDQADQSMDDLVYACGDGDMATVDRILTKMWGEGTSPVGVLRMAQAHFRRLHLAKALVDRGDTPDGAMQKLKPPVFFKLKPRFGGQLRRWPAERVAEALGRLVQAEADCKRTGLPAETICARTLYQLSRMAARR
jgi:DNA polymerase-3 subunit delta